ncbi:AbiH family protein [Listeria monocytogenes]|uniref:Phage abortive infection protein n=1 Tax=Listeria monocytogenes TaxID=1639 RepID=A0AB74N841_LISMN|nr:AbiH family protein [Listeria monocytogenes]EAC6224298.1 hypothetical protein [Listeria monocytogenes]EAF4053900.1 hypothetical protein [Listeria monocytogenes]EIO9134124.1 hypothetical protein [Listeria monocytogenes]EKK8152297.1 hypothetical protein [Listeria monocytogenes]EKK9552234.1 hypothetical protein [Listeria monocytogenes]
MYNIGEPKEETGLIILGNGLDINSSLPSKFIEYYQFRCLSLGLEINSDNNLKDRNSIQMEMMKPLYPREYAINNIIAVVGDDKLKNNITFWDLVLIYSEKLTGQENWCNIEWKILYVMEKLKIHLNKNLEELFQRLTNDEIAMSGEIQRKGIYELISELGDERKIYTWFAAFIKEIRESDYDDITIERFLLLELNKYEHAFSEYIKESMENNVLYLEERSKNIKGLISGIPYLNKINIMNFNFSSDVLANLTDVSVEKGIEVNVHGEAEENKVIFGVDAKSIDNIEQMNFGYDLTKTSRKLAMKTEWAISVLDETVVHVIFYGHSLSEADYAYFQSIFDYLDIYDKPIMLYFYYTNYMKETGDFETVRRNQTYAVRKLIEEYGSTFDNEAKGKNLLHKLLLEERISVLELECE